MASATPGAPSRIELTVAAHDPRERLDKLVVTLLARAGVTASRATVQRWIEAGRVRVDGTVLRASLAVRAGVTIVVEPDAPPATTAVADASIPVAVVYEDDRFLVVDKPAGLVVHPARGHASGTLVNALLGRGGFERAAADPRDPLGHLRPGIVHRIDKGTSGLLVVAKDGATREYLKGLFARHDVEREYVAIVVGAAEDATYDTPHGRHPTDRTRFTSRAGGRRAITHVRVVERLEGATLVSCRLETGRTHQIRVHLAERGKTPILGDELYGKTPRDERLRAVARRLGRPALHARTLGFADPSTGERLRWQVEPPADFAEAVAALRPEAARRPARATRSAT